MSGYTVGTDEPHKCENEDCNEIVPVELQGNLCSGYMDLSVGERWCSCCEKCRIECHLGALEED